jgi:UDP-N-acetyl-2-amino-2-deoxyglucuronate dehydrogenase
MPKDKMTTSAARDRRQERPLVCAFVGCSSFSRSYLSVYRDMPGVSVKVCVDIELERARLAVALLNAKQSVPAAFATVDFRAALSKDIDLVVINTPNHLHREHALAALECGKHVFLQKPLAASMTDALAIQAVAKKSKGSAGIYMSYFDHPIIHDLRSMARAGWFGSITQIHARLMHSGGLIWSQEAAIGSPSWRGSIEQTGGGVFIQLAVHYLRIANWILDDSIVRIFGFASNLNCPGLEGEDTAAAVIEFARGCMATLNVSWCARGEEISVHGTEGYLTYLDNKYVTMQSPRDFKGHILDYTGPEPQSLECDKAPIGDAGQPFNQHRRFVEDVRSGRPPFISIDAGVQDVAVAAAFYESVRSGRPASPADSAAMMLGK